MIHAGHNILGSTVSFLGLTFKEACPDLRNSKIIAGDVLHSQADISNAAGLLGYLPSHTIDEGLDTALSWYMANL